MVCSCFSIVSLYGRFINRSLASAGLSSQTVELDNSETTVHLWGPPSPTSKPSLVLIHGFGTPGAWQWCKQVAFFVPDFDVYMPDLIFFGDSFSSSRERSHVFQATCLMKALEKVGVNRFSVVGTSYGGFVAHEMALKWPDRVDKVVLASSGLNMRQADNLLLFKKANVNSIEELLLPTTANNLRAMQRLCFYQPPYMPDFLLNDFIHKLFSDNTKEKLELLQGLTIGKDDTATSISPLPQDVLIVWGEHDQIFLLERAMELEKMLGEKASLQVIKKTSHVPQLEQPAQFNNIVNNFLHGAC